jgi:hypothetical protein
VLTDPSLTPTPDQVRDARQRLSAAQAARSSADSAVNAAQGRLDAARRLALDAKHLREADARTTAGKIHEAADAGIPERSRWEKFKDWAGEAWHVIVEVAKVVVAVLGVVALIIGGPLAWVVFAAALVLLADSIIKYLNGQGSLWDVGFALLGCIPGTKGLTTLAELRMAFKAGGLLSAGAHVLGAGRTALASMATSLRAMSGEMRTVLVAFGDRVALRLRTAPALLRGIRSMAQSEFGVMGTLRNLPELMRVPLPTEGMQISRIFGSQLDNAGRPFLQPGKNYPFGSTPFGQSWTPSDLAHVGDFRIEAGLPHENPARFFVDGNLTDVSAVHEIRLALPLDGNPGGLPEYIVHGADDAVDVTNIGGVNESWTTPPGAFVP